jgi:surface polysaccharide O-acyltransferase-like enzyme
MQVPNFQLAIESNFWIYSVFAFGYKYLNHPSKALTYLSQAAYPIYIIHMVFLFLASSIIFPLELNVFIKFILVLFSTFIGSLVFYEFVIRRIKVISPLFGLKMGK